MMPSDALSQPSPSPAPPPGLGALPPEIGRTVRDIVESTPAAVTDGWCRQVGLNLLRSVETQQAMAGPHRIIMPDSVVVHADGAIELLAAADQDSAMQPPTAVDLKAIATVLHFAISAESPPAGPLLPRSLPEFSPALLESIDLCLYGDRSARPHSIEAMRALLQSAAAPLQPPQPPQPPQPLSPMALEVGAELEQAIAGLEAAVALPAVAPASASAPAPEAAATAQPQATGAADGLGARPASVAPAATVAGAAAAAGVGAGAGPGARNALPGHASRHAAQGTSTPHASAATAPPLAAAPTAAAVSKRSPRLLLIGVAIAVVAAGGYGMYQKGHQAGASAMLPGAPGSTVTPALPDAAALPDASALPDAAAAAPGTEVREDGAARAGAIGSTSGSIATVATIATPAASAGSAAGSAAASVTYKLMIKPWGTVYVDGVKRGVSPPLKSLTLTGVHTVRVDNPEFPSYVVTVRPGQDPSTRIEHAFH